MVEWPEAVETAYERHLKVPVCPDCGARPAHAHFSTCPQFDYEATLREVQDFAARGEDDPAGGEHEPKDGAP